MRFYLEPFTFYGPDTARYICIYIGFAHAKGQSAKLLGFEWSKMQGKRLFRTFPAWKLFRPKLKLKYEEVTKFCESLYEGNKTTCL